MTSRFRPIGLLGTALLAFVGCDAALTTGPILYRESERAPAELASKPQLRKTIQTALATNFGPDLQHLVVPANTGLREGGIYLADRMKVGDKVVPVTAAETEGAQPTPIKGGYALYRTHCIHCHGVAGAGDGPTAAFLFPRPRDYRPGIFKFTSTNPANAKPSRADLRKTLLYGLHGTSMPGFEATMSLPEIDQVIDYLTFLSIRGETERNLIDEAVNSGDADDPSSLDPDLIRGVIEKVAGSWTEAESQVVNPGTRRVASTPDSVKRGRDLFLGVATSTGVKLECVSCHGPAGRGNGPAFIDQGIFDDVVFRQYSFDEAAARDFRVGEEKKHAAAHAKADPAGVAQFLQDNPAILAVLRKDHNLLGDAATDPQFAYLIKNDMAQVVGAARKLLPELDDPRFREFLVSKYDLWTKGSLDEWRNPLRPANLIAGVYKGGRRPIDLYWRLAKGINGAKMPAHSGILNDDQIWDIVNFVLALPEQPDLLPEPAPADQDTKTAASTRGADQGTR